MKYIHLTLACCALAALHADWGKLRFHLKGVKRAVCRW